MPLRKLVSAPARRTLVLLTLEIIAAKGHSDSAYSNVFQAVEAENISVSAEGEESQDFFAAFPPTDDRPYDFHWERFQISRLAKPRPLQAFSKRGVMYRRVS